MVKKRVVILLGLFIMLIIATILAIVINFAPEFYSKITGQSIKFVSVNVIIEEGEKMIIIILPENKTYNFSKGEGYTMELKVLANFNVSSWKYTLVDLKHNEIVYENVIFDGNKTTNFNAVRWSNKLIVYASDDYGKVYQKDVVFFVNVPNSAPIIEYIAPEIYTCENDEIAYYFNVTDIDEDYPTAGVFPSNPFFAEYLYNYNLSLIKKVYWIFSGTLANGEYKDRLVKVDDNYNETCCIDTKYTNITVIEINDAPSMEIIGVQTKVWIRGENITFNRQVQVNDKEDGNQNDGNLIFNLTILNSTGSEVNLFNISLNGTMNYTSNETQIGIYDIRLCVTDKGIENPHEKIIEVCEQDGSAITVCQDFSLTVTDENRPPTITSYYPKNLSLSVAGTDNLYFNITKYDPDGTLTDSYWYVDDIMVRYSSGMGDYGLFDEFEYSFGCGVSGEYIVKAEITDGLLNDSVEWTLNVALVECPTETPSEGGGGGGGGEVCKEEWVCRDWTICQNAEKSLAAGFLSGEDYRIIKENCSKNSWGSRTCGFQTRNCFDLNNCEKLLNKPGEIQSCLYTERPSCHDGIKNCHDGSCEFLIDCGGPCSPCPTCSDGIQNQGEEGIDCGGPCPWLCPPEKPFIKKSYLKYVLIALIILVSMIIVIRFINIMKIRKEVKKHSKKGKR